MSAVKEERTGWRDLGLSQRHRQWGFDCPCVDIDFLALEYDNSKAVALIEYKHERAPFPPDDASVRALVDLAERAGIPCFFVHYSDDYSWFDILPRNALASEWVASRRTMDEARWVETLYLMRRRILPAAILADITRRP